MNKQGAVKLNEIVFEKKQYWIRECPDGEYEVYKKGVTHSTRCAQIGFTGEVGLQKAKDILEAKIGWDMKRLHKIK